MAKASGGEAPQRPLRPPGRITCTDEERYHFGPAGAVAMYESEDECLDQRAWQKASTLGHCSRVMHRQLRHLLADGTADWTCDCFQNQCSVTDSPTPSPSCGEHPETREPLTTAAIAALCRGPLYKQQSAPAKKGRLRYCANAVQQVIGDCHPPPGGQGCIAPRGLVPAYRCFYSSRECEQVLADARKAGLRGEGIDSRCTTIQP